MLGRTNSFPAAGSSISAINSYLVVMFPSGSVCTCTNGTKTYRAPNTGGAVFFSIPSIGDWTVSCTDGTRTKSRTVTMAANSVVSVTLNYELILVQNGIIVANYTLIGFKMDDSRLDSVQPNTEQGDGYYQISLDRYNSSQGGILFDDPIDLTAGYTYIEITGQAKKSSNSVGAAYLRLVSELVSTTTYPSFNYSYARHDVADSGSWSEITNTRFDLTSGLPDEAYLLVAVNCTQNAGVAGMRIVNMKLG